MQLQLENHILFSYCAFIFITWEQLNGQF